jgi:hypothetical protein
MSFVLVLGSMLFALCSLLNAFAVLSAGWVSRFPYRELMAQNKRNKPQNIRSTFKSFPLDY